MADDAIGKGQGGRLPTRYTARFHAFRAEMDRLFDNVLTAMPAPMNFRQTFPAAQGLTPNPAELFAPSLRACAARPEAIRN